MVAIMKIAIKEASNLLGMASSRRMNIEVEVYEFYYPHCDHTFDARCPVWPKQFVVGLGNGILGIVWQASRWVMDTLFEASAEVGEWFAGALNIELPDALAVRPLLRDVPELSARGAWRHGAAPYPLGDSAALPERQEELDI